MRDKTLLKLYKSGRKDFRGEDLRGQSFEGQDLSDANFSGADIRGTNFSRATLRRVNFSQAKAGLPYFQALLLYIASFLLISVSSLIFGVFNYFTKDIFRYFTKNSLTTIYSHYFFWNYLINGEVIALLIVVVSLIILARKGLASSLFFLIIGFFILIILSMINFPGFPYLNLRADVSIIQAAFSFFLIIFILAFTTGFASVYSLTRSRPISVTVAFFSFCISIIFISFHFGISSGDEVDFGIRSFTPHYNLLHRPNHFALFFSAAAFVLGSHIGWQAIDENSKYEFIRNLVITFTTFGGTNFEYADLTDSNFWRAKLHNSDFTDANILRTCWHLTQHLNLAKTESTMLRNPSVRNLLVTLKGEKKSYIKCNLRGASLVCAELSDVDLTGANISDANFEDACLERANLTNTQALNTNFNKAKLTGACLESWNTNTETSLEDVICDFVYLFSNQRERCPSSGNFGQGEFAKIFQEAKNTIPLIFREGLNWKAFAYSFLQVNSENESAELEVRGIHNKGDGIIVVELDAALNTNKSKIHEELTHYYSLALDQLTLQYEARVEDKDKQINQLFTLLQKSQEKLGEVPKLMAENQVPKYDMRGSSFGNFADTIQSGGKQQNVQHIYASEPKASLAETAQEIQVLLKQLEAANPHATEDQQIAYVNSAIPPTLKQRAVAALKEGGETAVDEFLLENKYLKVGKAVVKGWLQANN